MRETCSGLFEKEYRSGVELAVTWVRCELSRLAIRIRAIHTVLAANNLGNEVGHGKFNIEFDDVCQRMEFDVART
jgi:hypothetical protein